MKAFNLWRQVSHHERRSSHAIRLACRRSRLLRNPNGGFSIAGEGPRLQADWRHLWGDGLDIFGDGFAFRPDCFRIEAGGFDIESQGNAFDVVPIFSAKGDTQHLAQSMRCPSSANETKRAHSRNLFSHVTGGARSLPASMRGAIC
jgi:hypothetical protein